MSSLNLDRTRRLGRIRHLAGTMKWVVAALFVVLVLTGLVLIAALIWPVALGAGGEVFFMVLGTLMLLFGWILCEAATIADENRQFV